MKRKLALGALCALMLLSGMLAALPASWLGAYLSQLTRERWQLSAAQGSLWSGRGQPVFVAEDGSVLAATPLAWRFDPAQLLKAQLAWQIESEAGRGSLSLGAGGWQARQLAVSMPVAALAGLSDTWRAARLGGLLRLEIEQMAHSGQGFSGGASLSWVGAASPMTRRQPFGSYRLEAFAQGRQLDLRMQTLSGPLMISADGRWLPGKLPDLAGRAECAPEVFADLRPLMLMLGQPAGAHAVAWRARNGI